MIYLYVFGGVEYSEECLGEKLGEAGFLAVFGQILWIKTSLSRNWKVMRRREWVIRYYSGGQGWEPAWEIFPGVFFIGRSLRKVLLRVLSSRGDSEYLVSKSCSGVDHGGSFLPPAVSRGYQDPPWLLAPWVQFWDLHLW